MPIRKANAAWEGSLTEGKGRMKFGSGAFDGAYSFSSRFEEGTGTNPEELIGAAHAGCFSMALSADLGKAGFNPQGVETNATVRLEKVEQGFSIKSITLDSIVDIAGVDEDKLKEIGEGAKKNCPVSRALTGVDIDLKIRLKN